ncbi:SMP-30/gluconolactonase/LRE family protein [Chelativorans sp. YIM 93263]|uniref:SMP-30/gluconolactonase/LRE family protein n=1 Tax=Chelativorans sp. YIM 93263 TaxID=2906648 RepID=UPI00237988B1|nr:SMP-30/gluconolactonase/LRE family protein [Chelativorans sp. YIM 93263]
MDRQLEFDFLSMSRATLGESPVWSAGGNCLWWVDIEGSRVFRTDASTGRTVEWSTPEMAGIAACCGGGGVVVGMESGLFHLHLSTGHFERVAALNERGVRFNDATVDSMGRLWAATMEFAYRRPAGILYRIDPDFTMHEVVTGLFIPNGLAVDEERGRLYFSDSHPDLQTVWCADLDFRSGSIGERRIFARFENRRGRPDGATIDADGNYWIAGVGGGSLHVFSPEGDHLHQYEVPVDNPTKIAFGGSDLNQIYLTSKADRGNGGRLAVTRTGSRGRMSFSFGDRLRERDHT